MDSARALLRLLLACAAVRSGYGQSSPPPLRPPPLPPRPPSPPSPPPPVNYAGTPSLAYGKPVIASSYYSWSGLASGSWTGLKSFPTRYSTFSSSSYATVCAFGGQSYPASTSGAYGSILDGSDTFPWFQVDLGSRYTVTDVQLWSRADCCQTRMGRLSVFVTDTSSLVDNTRSNSWLRLAQPGVAQPAARPLEETASTGRQTTLRGTQSSDVSSRRAHPRLPSQAAPPSAAVCVPAASPWRPAGAAALHAPCCASARRCCLLSASPCAPPAPRSLRSGARRPAQAHRLLRTRPPSLGFFTAPLAQEVRRYAAAPALTHCIASRARVSRRSARP
jgi:hypothetical protein